VTLCSPMPPDGTGSRSRQSSRSGQRSDTHWV